MSPSESAISIDPIFLTKLRLVVARFGEMDGAAWWNTNGVLGKLGGMALGRGFPTTHPLTRARIVFSVATTRCNEVFHPPGCFTLWNLTPEIEESVDAHWQIWCRDVGSWTAFIDTLANRNGGDLLTHLRELDLIDEATVQAASKLRRSDEGKSVLIPGGGHPTPATVMLLAAGFTCGTKGQPAIPYLRA